MTDVNQLYERFLFQEEGRSWAIVFHHPHDGWRRIKIDGERPPFPDGVQRKFVLFWDGSAMAACRDYEALLAEHPDVLSFIESQAKRLNMSEKIHEKKS